MWFHQGGEWQEIRLIVASQESRRNVCEHALRSAKPCTKVSMNSHQFQESCPQHQKQQVKKKNHLNTRFTSSYTLPKLTISLIFAINHSVRFSICIDIRILKTRLNNLFFMYPTVLL